MTHTKLLVIVGDNHMSATNRTAFDARAKIVADKVGAELLVLEPGQNASLLDVRVPHDLAPAVDAIHGTAMGFTLDPLEQSIDQAVRLVAESEGELAVKLSRHLDLLLAEQLCRVAT
jgi:hypothetical protein